MLTSLIISFRECLEMLLIIVPLLVYLGKTDKSQLSKYVYGGCLIGVLSSITTGTLIFNQVKALEFAVQSIFNGSLMIFLAALVLYNMVLMNKQKQQLDFDTAEKFTTSGTALNLFLLAFTTIFRESLEITLFTLPYFTSSGLSIAIGTLLGIFIAIIFMYVIYKTSLKLSVGLIFNIITLILIFIGALMFGEGLAAFFPAYGDSIEKAGIMVYGIPTLLLFIKKALKSLVRK